MNITIKATHCVGIYGGGSGPYFRFVASLDDGSCFSDRSPLGAIDGLLSSIEGMNAIAGLANNCETMGTPGQTLTIPISMIEHRGYTAQVAPGGQAYIEAMAADVDSLPPIYVYPHSDGEGFCVKNGNHRIAAHLLAGRERIKSILLANEFSEEEP